MQTEETQAKVTTACGRRPEWILSAVTDQVDNQVVGVLNARTERRFSPLGAGADEEQLPAPNLGQRQGFVDLGDAAGSWKVLERFGEFKVSEDLECSHAFVVIFEGTV